MRLLVTGGAGFIGSNFIRYMLDKYPDIRITNLDKLTYAGNLDNTKDFRDNPNYSFVKGDVRDNKTVEKLVKEADLIVHFAAESHVDRSIEEAGSFVLTDVYGTFQLVEAAKKFGLDRFVHISTDEVYGSIKEGEFREDSPLLPRNPYSASKAGAECIARSYHITHKVPILVTRSSNNFGPYQHPEKLIPKFITNAIRDMKLPLYGKGKNVRDWLYVTDNCSAIDLVLQKGKPGEVYNVGGGNERKNIEITRIILEHLGKPEDLIEFVEDRKGHDWRYALDSSKISNLGWRPESDFESDLRKTIDWYRENEWWWRKLV